MNKILTYLANQSKFYIVTLAVFLVLIIGMLDFLTGNEFSISVFYLIPVILVTWLLESNFSWAITLMSALTWLIADLSGELKYSSILIPFWNALVRLGFFITVVILLTALKSALKKEKELARTDSLTGAANNRLFYELTQREIYRSARSGKPISLAYIDLDNFKTLNDTFGHMAGDFLLCLVVQTIKDNIRILDTVARLGGDEFAVLMPETGDEHVKFVVERIRNSLLTTLAQKSWEVTFSIGVVTFQTPPKTVDEMVQKADQVMYTVKNSTKNDIKYEISGNLARSN